MFDVCIVREIWCTPEKCRECKEGIVDIDEVSRIDSPEEWRELYESTLPRGESELQRAWKPLLKRGRLPRFGWCPCSEAGLSCLECSEAGLCRSCVHSHVWQLFHQKFPAAAHQAVLDYVKGMIP